MIFDTQCHLNDEPLYSRIDEVIESAHKVGVDKFLVVGWDKESSLLAVKLAHQYEGIYAAIGFHPCNVEGVSEEDYQEVMSHVNDPKVVAIGEIGLDYHWVKDPVLKENQKKWFIKQIGYDDNWIRVLIAFSICLVISMLMYGIIQKRIVGMIRSKCKV